MKINFVFTNYNNTKHTINVVESINKFSSDSKIIIVDNNSCIRECDALRELESNWLNVKVIYNNLNVGYFKGLNIGIEFVINNYKYDAIVIGNNDLIFPETFIDEITNKSFLLNNYPVISPNIITLDNECQNPHVIRGISKLRHLLYDIYYFNYTFSKLILKFAKVLKFFTKRKDYLESSIPQVIYQGYGACYILGPVFFKYYNQLFAPTFLMGEEFFLAYQLKMHNLELFYEPSIKVFHQDHATTGLIDSYRLWSIYKKSHQVYKLYLKSYE